MIPSQSIVVGLILVFRNSTSYDRFWQGQNQLTLIQTSVRNLTRSFLTCSYAADKPESPTERAETEDIIRVLLAYIYAVKTHLRAEWGTVVPSTPSSPVLPNERDPILAVKLPRNSSFEDLLPQGVQSFEEQGLGLPQQLAVSVEAYIKRGFDRGWFHAPQASQLTVQLNTAVQAFSIMETIRITPIPVAYLIHIRQVLALFGGVLPFAMVGEIGWWTVLVVSLVTFTLYGIEGIGQQLEDPFGYDKNDIKMDNIIEDLRVEIMVLLDQWRIGGPMFKRGDSCRSTP